MDSQATDSNKFSNKNVQNDKRVDHRHTLALDAEVHFREQALKGMFRCSTSNIGLAGAFFSAKNLPITQKTEIDVVFFARAKAEKFRLCAKLVRTQDDGAAVIFCPSDKEQTQDFRRFLFKAKVAARK